jgi:hypothetical protein
MSIRRYMPTGIRRTETRSSVHNSPGPLHCSVLLQFVYGFRYLPVACADVIPLHLADSQLLLDFDGLMSLSNSVCHVTTLGRKNKA